MPLRAAAGTLRRGAFVFQSAHGRHNLERGTPIHLVQQTLGPALVATTGRYLCRPSQPTARRDISECDRTEPFWAVTHRSPLVGRAESNRCRKHSKSRKFWHPFCIVQRSSSEFKSK